MSYTIKKYPDEPILVVSVNEDYHYEESSQINAEIEQFLNALQDPVMLILDLTYFHLSLQELLERINDNARNNLSILRHPVIKERLIVTKNKGLVMMAKGLDTLTFGNIKVLVFPTVERAVEYARTGK